MRRLSQLLGLALISLTTWAEPERGMDEASERQPGMLRISGIQDGDRVLLDGELLGDARRIHRFGGKLLMNPGTYQVTVVSAEGLNACSTEVRVRENRTAVASCSRNVTDEQLVD